MNNNQNQSKFFEKTVAEVDEEVQEFKSSLFCLSKSAILPSRFIKKWSSTYDDSMLLDKSLNAFAGEVRLSIPLVDVQITPTLAIVYDLTYDQPSKAFKDQFLDDFISVDYQNSVFNEVSIYRLNLRGIKSQIKRTSVENEFYLDGSDVKIFFDPLKQQWLIENLSDRVVYGNSGGNGAIKHGLLFQNWSGRGNDARNLNKIPLTWFIAERHSKTFGTSIFYKYHVVQEKFLTSNSQYTSVVHLKEISTNNDVLNVKFNYQLAPSTDKKKFIDAKGNFLLNDLMVDNHNLIAVFIETKEYQQVRQFF